MSQFDFGNLESPLSGEEFINSNLEPWRDALHSMHSDSGAPDYRQEGLMWLKTGGDFMQMRLFINADDDIEMNYIDPDEGLIQWGRDVTYYSFAGLDGTANAIVITETIPWKYEEHDANFFVMRAGITNTGPVTIQILDNPVRSVKKQTPTGYVPLEAGDIKAGLPVILFFDQNVNTYISILSSFDGLPKLRTTNKTVDGLLHMGREISTAAMTYTFPAGSTLPDNFYFDYFAQGGAITFTPSGADSPGDTINAGNPGVSVTAPIGSSGRVTKDEFDNWWITGIDAVGSIVQSIMATPYTAHTSLGTGIPIDDTIPQISDGGTQIMSVAITPKFANSKLRVRYGGMGINAAPSALISAVFRDSTANAVYTSLNGDAGAAFMSIAQEFEVAASSIASTTFKLQLATATGTFWTNGDPSGRYFGGSAAWFLTVEEIRQ